MRCAITLLAMLPVAVTATGPERVFFVGNSYTYYNGGIDLHLELFYASANPGLEIETDAIIVGGATLEDHWGNPDVISALSSGYWEMVVLQEHSTRSVTDPLLTYQYADSLGNLAASSGSMPVFFMTWPRKNDPMMMPDLQSAYIHAAGLSGGNVVPVGRAFERSLTENPGIELYTSDGSHPSVYATYLAVCVFYSFLWEDCPVGVEYVSSPDITHEERLALQTTAWNTYLQWTITSDPSSAASPIGWW